MDQTTAPATLNMEENIMFRKEDWIFGLISIIIGGFVLFSTQSLLRVQNMTDPAGPAALPRIIAVVMIIIGVIHVFFSLLKIKNCRVPGQAGGRAAGTLKPVFMIVAASIVFIFFLDILGYPIAMLLLIIAVMSSVGVRDIKELAMTSVITTVVLFAAFFYGLNVSLPLGIFERFF